MGTLLNKLQVFFFPLKGHPQFCFEWACKKNVTKDKIQAKSPLGATVCAIST